MFVVIAGPLIGILAPRAAAQEPITVRIVVTGDEARRSVLQRALRRPMAPPLQVEVADLRSSSALHDRAEAERAQEAAAALAAAEEAYEAGHVDLCLAALGEPGVVLNEIGERRRADASRFLIRRIACLVMHGSRNEEVVRFARMFYTLGLEPPDMREVHQPEVEAALAHASDEIGAAPRRSIRVRTDPSDARVFVDGLLSPCRGEARRCLIDLTDGDHVLRLEADGALSTVEIVHIEENTTLELRAGAAPPDVLRQQWLARYADTAAVDTEASVRLLAAGVTGHYVALLNVERERGARLRAVLMHDGESLGRAERYSDPNEVGLYGAAQAMLREILVRTGRLPRDLWELPEFWIVMAGVVALSVVATAAGILLQPEPLTQVTIRPGVTP